MRNKALRVSAREVTEKRLHETSIVPIEESDRLKGGMGPLDHRPWSSEVSCKNLGRGNLEISDQNQNFGALGLFKHSEEYCNLEERLVQFAFSEKEDE